MATQRSGYSGGNWYSGAGWFKPSYMQPKRPPVGAQPIWGGMGYQWGGGHAGPAMGNLNPLPEPGSVAPPPPPAGIPPDPDLEARKATAGRNVAFSDAEATYRKGQLRRDFGYSDDGAIDTSNPYSRAMLLEKSFQDRRRGTTNSYAAAGQLYSGALQNARNATEFDYGRDSYENLRGFRDAMNETTLGQTRTYLDNAAGLDPAILEAAIRALGALK